MTHRHPARTATFATVAAAAMVLTLSPAAGHAQVTDPNRPVEAVPEADCGPGSIPEPGLQGQVPIEDRLSGRSLDPYQCNLELLGSTALGDGASWQFAWYDHCAYYGTLYNEERETEQGTVVIDASDPENPFVSDVLTTPAMMDPHESLKVNDERGLLAAVELSGGADTGPPGEDYLDVYDVTGDCAHPELLSSQAFPITTGHEGEFAPDGMTYYGSGGGNVYAFDLTDPTAPEVVGLLNHSSHGLNFSADGNRGYLTGSSGGQNCVGGSALKIVDTSQIQSRNGAEAPLISDLCWTDGAIAQHPIPLSYDGVPYLLFVDEGGRGAARIIDISDETAPRIVSRLKLEVHLDQYAAFSTVDGGVAPIFVYDAHYCSVDRQVEPTIAACGYFESGIRVFDIRDPESPREIAYYNPGATEEAKPGSSNDRVLWSGTADHCSAQVRVVPPTEDPDTGEVHPAQLWTQCQDNEFMILEFTNGVWPFEDAPAASAESDPAGPLGRGGATPTVLLPVPLLGLAVLRRQRHQWRARRIVT